MHTWRKNIPKTEKAPGQRLVSMFRGCGRAWTAISALVFTLTGKNNGGFQV